MKTRILLCILVVAMLIPMFASCDEMLPPTVTSTEINDQGELIVLFSNGTEKNMGKVETPAAPTVESTTIDAAGDVIVDFSDGTQSNAGKAPVKEVKPTVVSTKINENGELIILFSDGTQQNLGKFDGGQAGDTPNALPEKINMNRYVYKAFVRDYRTGNGAFKCEDFYVDPATGGADALSYAVIARNNEIERDYNCIIKHQDSVMESQFDEMASFFDGGTTFELSILMAIDAAICAMSGYLSDLKAETNTQYMNLQRDGFDQNSIRDLTIGNSLYFLSGDMNISTMDNTMATIFNIDFFNEKKTAIAEKLGHEEFSDPYQMVEDGTWTLENMLTIANCVTVDAKDDDGELAYDKGDIIGYLEYQASPLYYYYGAGLRITKNEDGYPYFSITSNEAKEVYEYLFNSLNVIRNPHIPNGASGDRARNFLYGQVLFGDFILWDVRKQLYPATIDFAYGILPISTYEENADYHHAVYFQNCAHLWTIPYRRENIEYSARMMDIMAAYSAKQDSTMDAYYVRTMYMENHLDSASANSLDIIRNSLVYDIALLYTQNGLWGNFDKLLITIDTRLNMEYDAYTSEQAMKKATDEMQQTLDDFARWSSGN